MLEVRRCGPCALNLYLDEFALCDEVGLDTMVNERHSTARCLTLSVPMVLAIIARETSGYGSCPLARRSQTGLIGCALLRNGNGSTCCQERVEMGLVKGAPCKIAPANSKPRQSYAALWEADDSIARLVSPRLSEIALTRTATSSRSGLPLRVKIHGAVND
jgi:hypothetical protein